jgi:hypothetical protein
LSIYSVQVVMIPSRCIPVPFFSSTVTTGRWFFNYI